MPDALKLTERQKEVLAAAYTSSDGWLMRGFSRIWGVAPMAVMACWRKGYLSMPHGRGRVRLTPEGRALIEQNPEEFGLKRRAS